VAGADEHDEGRAGAAPAPFTAGGSAVRLRPALDVQVRLGRPPSAAVLYQSSAILQYSAPALVRHLVPLAASQSSAAAARPPGNRGSDRSPHRPRDAGGDEPPGSGDADCCPDDELNMSNDLTAIDDDPDDPHELTSDPHEDVTIPPPSPSNIQYLLDLPDARPADWRLLEPFLQPPTVGGNFNTLTPRHLVLLPWFLQLELGVLVERSDDILSRVGWDPSADSFRELLVRSGIARDAAGGGGGALARTSREVCRAWIRALSFEGAGHDDNDGAAYHPNPAFVRLADDLQSLASLCELLSSWPFGREELWIHLVRYLPPDLDVFSKEPAKGAAELLRNPLLPYLVRDGMHRHCGPTVAPDLFPAENSSAASRAAPASRAPSAMSEARPRDSAVSGAAAAHDRRPPGLGADASDWQSSLEEWFRWLVPTQEDCDEVAADIAHCPSSRSEAARGERPGSVAWGPGAAELAPPIPEILAQIPTDRLEWLEAIWERLRAPPVLPAPPPAGLAPAEGGGGAGSLRPRSPGRPSRRRPRRRDRDEKAPARLSSPGRGSSADPATPPRPRRYDGDSRRDGSRRSCASPHSPCSTPSTARSSSPSSGTETSSPRRPCSRLDVSTSSTLSTHKRNASGESGCDESLFSSSVGVVRPQTRTFYC
jgi:hypothetical protein